MKLSARSLFLVILALHASLICKANHIYGADFYYEYLTGNSYRVTMAIYGDCAGASFSGLSSSTPQIQLLNNGTLTSTTALILEGPGVDVTPVCPSQINNTACRGGSLPGVTRFRYSAIITVPFPSANWHFNFNGNMGNGNPATGRSNFITNLNIGGNGSVMVMDISLNNTTGNNSSPQFTTIPTPFFCVNVPQQYNQGAVDPNGDSLVYALTPALVSGGGTATYQNGFTPTDPMGLGTNFSFNTQNGQMSFTPTFTQNPCIVNSVQEYRNGVLVGTSSREMTFVVLGTCNNRAPTGNPDTTSGTYSGGIPNAATNTFTACEGSSIIQFKVNANDPDGDTIQMTINGLPAGATFSVTDNNTSSPSGVFHWNLTGVAPGTYNFFITYKDQGCPLSSQQTQAYTVRVVRAPSIIPQILYPTQCYHKAYIRLNLIDGLLPRNVVISQNGNVVRAFSDNTGVYTDSLDAGNYTVAITSNGSPCNTLTSFSIKDSGVFPYPPVVTDAFYCIGATSTALQATTVPGGSIFWYDSIGTKLSAPPVPATGVDGIFNYYASTQFKVCESDKTLVKVYVTKKPTADMSISPAVLCSYDTLTVTFSGSTGVGPILQYLWGWDGGAPLNGSGAGPWKVKWPSYGTKVLSLQVLENKCPSDTIYRQVNVNATPVAAFNVRNICLYDTMQIVYTADTLQGQQYAWSFDGASAIQGPAGGPLSVNWSTPGIKHIFLNVSKDGCFDTLSKYPVVYDAPDAVITTTPQTICQGDKIYLEHTGIGNFVWTPRLQIFKEQDGRTYTRVVSPTTYKLTITNEYGCVDSSFITYDNVEPCCNFSYPNAFTPNHDGKNDVFRVVTYGNDEHFALSIFDRWGQRIYYSGNPAEGWDGKVNGKDADAGTYFYTLTAKCLTGHEEFHKGDFTLIR